MTRDLLKVLVAAGLALTLLVGGVILTSHQVTYV